MTTYLDFFLLIDQLISKVKCYKAVSTKLNKNLFESSDFKRGDPTLFNRSEKKKKKKKKTLLPDVCHDIIATMLLAKKTRNVIGAFRSVCFHS